MINQLRPRLFWVSGDWSYDSNNTMEPYITWLEENCSEYSIQEKWNTIDNSDVADPRNFMGFAVYFKKEEDAVAFKLRWFE